MGCPDAEQLERFRAGTSSDDERGAFLDHAAGCAECHAVVMVLTASTARGTAGGPGDGALGPQIDRYQLRRVLGRGAMGVVYAARDPELDRDVAVKVLRSEASAARLRREAQALARLAHPNVVRVYDVGEHDGRTFIAMELVDGENLREWLRTPRTADEVVAVMVRAGHGLAAAHQAGMVHRDFKPDNVLLATTGGVLVGDFGLARSAEPPRSDDGAPPAAAAAPLSSSSLTATGAVVGTPAYMAPEQASGEATAASDQYAFCVTAWEACFGRRPIEGLTVEELRANARAGTITRSERRSVPARVEAALRRGLSPRPADRFASMEALLQVLAPPARRRWPWVAGALALATAGAVIVVGGARGPAAAPRTSCAEAGALIAPAWDDGVERAIAARWSPRVAGGFARYAASWQRQRIDACRATHERREQTVATLELRVGCLDRARAALHATIDALMATAVESLPRPDAAVERLPSLERCERATPAPASPPADRADAIAALDTELATLDVALLAGSPSMSPAAAVALRRRAEGLGDPPQVLRAMLLEARVAAWNGDAAEAEAGLRRVMLAAEQIGDDFTRAHAGALLAGVIADRRVDEAAALAAAARAALARAGVDPAIEQALLEAEVGIATSRGDPRGALAIEERIVALVRARFGDDSGVVVNAYSQMHALSSAAGDFEQALVWSRRSIEASARIDRLDGAETDEQAILREQIIDLTIVGDFEGAVALGRRQLALLRALPAHSLQAEAYVVDAIGATLELDGDDRGALDAYREGEQLWSRPDADFTTVEQVADPAAIANGRINDVLGQGGCLLELGRADEAVVVLRRARALARAGGPMTAARIASSEYVLGQALVETGGHREARDLLEPLVERLDGDTEITPFPRALARFALAQALWTDGSVRDRPRALALADDAERDLQEAIADGERPDKPFLRKQPARARAVFAALAAWRAGHPAR